MKTNDLKPEKIKDVQEDVLTKNVRQIAEFYAVPQMREGLKTAIKKLIDDERKRTK